MVAQGSCSISTNREDLGQLSKREHLSVTGTLCGFPEFTYKGAWSSTAQYAAGDSVFYNGAFWSGAGAIGEAPTCTSSWSKIERDHLPPFNGKRLFVRPVAQRKKNNTADPPWDNSAWSTSEFKFQSSTQYNPKRLRSILAVAQGPEATPAAAFAQILM